MTRTMTALAAALLAAMTATAFAAGSRTQTPAPAATMQHGMKNASKSQAALPSSDHTMSARKVEEIQVGLQRAGYKVASDGIWGPSTAHALRSFQKDHGLKATGRYNQATAQQLEIPHWS